MAEQEVKNQHFVPRTYMKHFSERRGDNYFIKALPVSNPVAESIIEKNTKKTCFEKHLYTLPGDTVGERMLLEKFYGDEFEQHYNTIYAMLTDPNKNELSEDERKLIIGTVTTMLYRVPLWIKKYNAGVKVLYEQAFAKFKQTGQDEFDINGETVSIAGKTLEDILEEHQAASKPSQVLAQLDAAMQLLEVRFANDNIFISKLVDADSLLIISDNPVVIQNIDGSKRPVNPFDPSNIIKLPLDKDHILMLMPTGEKEHRHIIRRHDASGVMCKREAVISNSEQYKNADIYILGSTDTLNNYLATKALAEEDIPYGTDGKPDPDFMAKLKDAGLIE